MSVPKPRGPRAHFSGDRFTPDEVARFAKLLAAYTTREIVEVLQTTDFTIDRARDDLSWMKPEIIARFRAVLAQFEAGQLPKSRWLSRHDAPKTLRGRPGTHR